MYCLILLIQFSSIWSWNISTLSFKYQSQRKETIFPLHVTQVLSQRKKMISCPLNSLIRLKNHPSITKSIWSCVPFRDIGPHTHIATLNWLINWRGPTALVLSTKQCRLIYGCFANQTLFLVSDTSLDPSQDVGTKLKPFASQVVYTIRTKGTTTNYNSRSKDWLIYKLGNGLHWTKYAECTLAWLGSHVGDLKLSICQHS